MGRPRRSAEPRSAEAIAEDLLHARPAGLLQANEEDVRATLDLLTLIEGSGAQTLLTRARDLLVHYVGRVCDLHLAASPDDREAQAAANSLRTLLVRQPEDRRKVSSIRSEAIRNSHARISEDGIRHREDAIIRRVAVEVFAELVRRRDEGAASMEAAVHDLMPLAIDIRDDLHDFLCLTYLKVPPTGPMVRKLVDYHQRHLLLQLGRLLLACDQVIRAGRRTPELSGTEFLFMRHASGLGADIFDSSDVRMSLRELIQGLDLNEDAWEEAFDALLSQEAGRSLYDHWLDWIASCFPTCAFERSMDSGHMCSPHQLVTTLYQLEISYAEAGYADVQVPDVRPVMHHRLDGLVQR